MIRRLFLVGHVLIRWGRVRGDELFAMKLGGGEPDVIDGLAEMRRWHITKLSEGFIHT